MSALEQAIKKHMQEERDKLISPKPCALFISFYNTQFIDEVRNQFCPLFGDFHRINDYLVKIYPSGDEAKNIANTIHNIIINVNNILLNTPFEKDWLDKYLAAKSYGINIAFPQYEVKSLEEAEAFIERKIESRNNDIESQKYIEASDKAKSRVLNENKNTIVEAWTDFISNNWISTFTKDEVYQMFSNLFSTMADEAKGSDFFTTHPSQRLHLAIQKKDELLWKELKNNKEAANVERVAMQIKTSHETEKEVYRRLTDNSEVFERLLTTCTLFFRTNSAKYKGQFTVEQAPLNSPFKGTDFFFPTYETPETLLGKDSVDSTCVQNDKLDKPLTKLASAFTVYLYTYAEIKQKEQFKSSLFTLAKNINKTPYHTAILKILDESRPF